MAKRKTVEQQIAETMEKIKQEQNALKKLQKKQTEQNNKARNHRLCKRHGFLESILPDLIDLTDEQYQKFVKQHIANSHGINALEKIKVQASTTPQKPAEATAQSANTAIAKPPETTPQPVSPAPQKPAGAEQNQKPTAPAGATHKGNTPPKNNSHNVGNNLPTQGTPQGKPA